jgi:hypothetical protein
LRKLNKLTIRNRTSPVVGNITHIAKSASPSKTSTSNWQLQYADFITITDSQSFYDWMLPNIDDDGALRSAFLAKIDGSSVCPTGFNVPTEI